MNILKTLPQDLSIRSAGALYQGTTLVVPLQIRRKLGFSPCLLSFLPTIPQRLFIRRSRLASGKLKGEMNESQKWAIYLLSLLDGSVP
jgi:hypothetical protein